MERIRIVLGGRFPELHAVFDEMAQEPDLEFSESAGERIELLLTVGERKADVVILNLEDSELPGISTVLLDAYPELKVLAIADDGHQSFLYELRPQKIQLGEISAQRMIDAIRSAVRT